MRRELEQFKTRTNVYGHWPSDTFKSNRSKRARSRDKKKEHKYVRTLVSRLTKAEVNKTRVDYEDTCKQ